MFTLLGSVFLLSSALVAHAGVTQGDFTGVGNIYVLKSSDWRNATMDMKVGCLDNKGKFVQGKSKDDCGVFERLGEYPYTLSTKEGNCTFNDETQEKNTDSYYGKGDFAWNCNASYESVIYDELYTIDGFPYPFLCFGDIACYYDAKRVPATGETTSLWQFRWGSQQRGITPGHVMLQLMWNKLSDLPKREGTELIPSPRIQLQEGQQVPLHGQEIKA